MPHGKSLFSYMTCSYVALFDHCVGLIGLSLGELSMVLYGILLTAFSRFNKSYPISHLLIFIFL